MTFKLIDVALPVPLPQLFTYGVPEQFETVVTRGTAVVVPFGKKVLTGIVVGFPKDKPNFTIKQITGIADLQPIISDADISLSEWISDYYNTPLGDTPLSSGRIQPNK